MILILDEKWHTDTTSGYLTREGMTGHNLWIGHYHASIAVDSTHRTNWHVTVDPDSEYDADTFAKSDGWTTESVDAAKLRCEALIREHYLTHPTDPTAPQET